MTSVVVMGVTGSGKSTIAVHLAAALGYVFLDADSLHPRTSIAKMAAGIPLNDDDRYPWLDVVGRAVVVRPTVVACSALRFDYRERLRDASPGLRFVYLVATKSILAQRMRSREHFMPASLLDSQLETLEEPRPSELAIRVDSTLSPQTIVDHVLEALRSRDEKPSHDGRC
ncbi:gluconokinase [Microbacteriaceae bacterium VKM Ac-2855]|nr:gluconokinase [Microbacteriaceae bacterium VKM Ac-2855]